MPAKSKQQQKFMGIVRAIQKGDAKAGDFSKKARDAAKKMKKNLACIHQTGGGPNVR